MKNRLKFITLVVVVMVFATIAKIVALGKYNPYTDDVPSVWSHGLITKLLSFQNPFFTGGGSDNLLTLLCGSVLVFLTLWNAYKFYENAKLQYSIVLVTLTVIRLGYWLPYVYHNI